MGDVGGRWWWGSEGRGDQHAHLQMALLNPPPCPTFAPPATQQAAVVSQTVLAENIAALVSGAMNQTEFEEATSPEALEKAVRQASLPGTPSGGQEPKSKATAIGVGE